LHHFSCQGDYFFLEFPFLKDFIPEDASVPFFPYFPYDHPRNENPTEVHLFIFIVTLIPVIDGCTDVTSGLIGLLKDTCHPVPDPCCVVTFIEEMIHCFFLSLIEVAP
jgi:hypothetical protein